MSRLGARLRSFALSAGRTVIEKALTLYYCLKDSDTPAWARGVIMGSLGYFVMPLDAIPDIVPVAGFSDDLGALVVALGIVAYHIKKEHADKARRKLEKVFKGLKEAETGQLDAA